MDQSQNPCLEFFKANVRNNKKVELLQNYGDITYWESLQASSLSSGVVMSDEELARCIFNPIHIDIETGEIKPSAISDVKDKGCSVSRLSLCSKEVILEQAKIMAQEKSQADPAKPRLVHGISCFSANKVREIVSEGKRDFLVFDTALEENRAHADIVQLLPNRTPQQARSARSKLFIVALEGFELTA